MNLTTDELVNGAGLRFCGHVEEVLQRVECRHGWGSQKLGNSTDKRHEGRGTGKVKPISIVEMGLFGVPSFKRKRKVFI